MRPADLLHGYEGLAIAQALAEDELRARGRLRRQLLARLSRRPVPVPATSLPRPRLPRD